MQIGTVLHCVTDEEIWKLFAGWVIRVTWGFEKLAKDVTMYEGRLISWVNDFDWNIPKQQLKLAQKYNNQLVVSIMPEIEIDMETFSAHSENLKAQFGGHPNIKAWDCGTEPTIVAKYQYGKYEWYYQIASEIFQGKETNAFGFTLISDKELGYFTDFFNAKRFQQPAYYGIHLYGSHKHQEEMLKKIRKITEFYHLWITETGWSSESHWYCRNPEQQQLEECKKCIQLYTKYNIDLMIVYNFRDDPNAPASDKFSKHCGLLRADNTPKPIYYWLKENHDK